MSTKSNATPPTKSTKSSSASHGNFKHTTQGSSLKAVLGAYGLKNDDFVRVRNLVAKQLSKEPAHAR